MLLPFEKHISSFEDMDKPAYVQRHLLKALAALSKPWLQCENWAEQLCVSVSVTVHVSRWPLWKTSHQRGQSTRGTLTVDLNGAGRTLLLIATWQQ